MKKAIIAIALSVFAIVGAATNADARPCGGNGYSTPANTIYVSGYRHGQPIYTEKVFVGYDCHGYPRFIYRAVYTPVRQYSQPCRPAYTSYNNGSYNNGSYNNGGYNNGGYNRSYNSYNSRSGSSISFTFRR